MLAPVKLGSNSPRPILNNVGGRGGTAPVIAGGVKAVPQHLLSGLFR
jgi:hypothetical protein